MRVFISWSREPSRSIAQALREWLPMVVQHVQPWMSAQDIESGARWNDEVAAELERSDFGIICLTWSNQYSPWLLFEAGALAKHLKVARVVPLYIDLRPSEVYGPLAAFQGVSLSEDGMRRLVHDVSAMRKKPMLQGQVDELFNAMWPRLESARLSQVVEGDARRWGPTSPVGPGPFGDYGYQVRELLTALRASIEAAKARNPSSGPNPNDEVVLVAPPDPDRGIEVDDPEAYPIRSAEGQTDAPEESSKPEE